MIIPLVLAPNIFEFHGPITEQYCLKYSNLITLLCSIKRRAIVLLDKKGFLQEEITENLINIDNDNIKLKLRLLLKSIYTGYTKKLDVKNKYEGDIEQTCGIFISLLNMGNYNGIYAESEECSEHPCKNCISNHVMNNLFTNIIDFDNSILHKALNKSNIIINNDCTIEPFKNSIIRPFVENSNSIIIYDEQISNLNKNASDIDDNFKRNINYWVDYFYSINKDLSLKFYTTIKDRGNSIQTKRKLQELSEQIQQKYNKNSFEIKIVSKKLHERYFCSEKFIFSCDKGIDIVNDSNELIENIHLSMLENEEAEKIRTEITQM